MTALASIVGLMVVVFVVIFRSLRSLPEREDLPEIDFDQIMDAPKKSRRRADATLVENTALARAIEATAAIAEKRGIIGSIESLLRAGDVPIRAAEFLFFSIVGAVLLGPLALFTLGTSPQGLVTLLVVVAGPHLGLRRYVKGRRKKFEQQLPDMLLALAAALRAGRSLGQAMEALSREYPDPMGRELRKIVAENQLGATLSDALDDASVRLESEDFDWAVMAMKIQAEVGGNLAELLDSVAETMRHREQFKGEVKALTAEGRASAVLLVGMPPTLGLVMFGLNRDYIAVLFETGTGKTITGISVAMLVMGWFAMQKVMKVDV